GRGTEFYTESFADFASKRVRVVEEAKNTDELMFGPDFFHLALGESSRYFKRAFTVIALDSDIVTNLPIRPIINWGLVFSNFHNDMVYGVHNVSGAPISKSNGSG